MGKFTIAIIAALLLIGAGLFFTSTTPEPEPGAGTTEETERADTATPSEADEGVTGAIPTPSEEDGAASETAAVSVVTYADDGFSPASVTIKRGDAVEFVNESSRDMWVASAVHPTHALYPETSTEDCLGSSFDACTGIAPGESWSFVFDQTGEWKYHNHRQASHVGAVVVTE